MKMIIFALLLSGMGLLFVSGNLGRQLSDTIQKTRWGMDAAARKRALEERKHLNIHQEKNPFLTLLERELYYSGLKLKFPGMTAEIFLTGNLVLAAFMAVFLSTIGGTMLLLMGIAVLGLTEYLVLSRMKVRNLKIVNENLMKLLDFLGNYSITTGEVAGVLFQVSRYMVEPVKTVLESCYYEAQTTGDVSVAILRMSERIEHPKFKELACNMEVSLRYCADLSALVSGSKRSMLEYLRSSRERKGMLREALISMALLLGMSFLILTAVGYLVQMTPVQLLLGTFPGKVGMFILLLIGVLFAGQLKRVHY